MTDRKKKKVRPKPPANYDENPPMTKADLAKMRPAAEVMPDLVAAAKRRRGRPTMGRQPKVPVSLRIDPDVLAAYKATGTGWQQRINNDLRRMAKLK